MMIVTMKFNNVVEIKILAKHPSVCVSVYVSVCVCMYVMIVEVTNGDRRG